MLELDDMVAIAIEDTSVDVVATIVDVGEEVGLSLVVGSVVVGIVVVGELYKELVLTGSLEAVVASVLLACVLAAAP